MEFLSKVCFFALFGISILLSIFLLMGFFDLLVDPYKKTSEAIIMLIGGCLLGVGLYIAYQYGYVPVNYVRGCIILIIAFITALLSVLIGLFFFNGPLHWQ
jgi:uncharacterized protein YjeT (DUF2065 family)